VSIDWPRTLGVLFPLFLLWVAHAYFHPFSKCWWCKGTGRNWGSTSKRFGFCWFCERTGRRQVLGSRIVHRAVRSIRGKRWGSK